jgi:hypothetical protein
VCISFRTLIEHIVDEPRNRDINDPRKELFKPDPNFQYNSYYVKGIVEEIWDTVPRKYEFWFSTMRCMVVLDASFIFKHSKPEFYEKAQGWYLMNNIKHETMFIGKTDFYDRWEYASVNLVTAVNTKYTNLGKPQAVARPDDVILVSRYAHLQSATVPQINETVMEPLIEKNNEESTHQDKIPVLKKKVATKKTKKEISAAVPEPVKCVSSVAVQKHNIREDQHRPMMSDAQRDAFIHGYITGDDS